MFLRGDPEACLPSLQTGLVPGIQTLCSPCSWPITAATLIHNQTVTRGSCDYCPRSLPDFSVLKTNAGFTLGPEVKAFRKKVVNGEKNGEEQPPLQCSEVFVEAKKINVSQQVEYKHTFLCPTLCSGPQISRRVNH